MPPTTTAAGSSRPYGASARAARALRTRGAGVAAGPALIAPASVIRSRRALRARVQDLVDLLVGVVRRLLDLLVPADDLREHVLEHVRILDVRPVLRGGDEPAVLGRLRERRQLRM